MMLCTWAHSSCRLGRQYEGQQFQPMMCLLLSLLLVAFSFVSSFLFVLPSVTLFALLHCPCSSLDEQGLTIHLCTRFSHYITVCIASYQIQCKAVHGTLKECTQCELLHTSRLIRWLCRRHVVCFSCVWATMFVCISCFEVHPTLLLHVCTYMYMYMYVHTCTCTCSYSAYTRISV